MEKLGSCGCERDGVGRREVGNNSQDAGGVEMPFTEIESIRGGERTATVWNILVNCQNLAWADLKVPSI